MAIIFSYKIQYCDALQMAKIPPLKDRRQHLTTKFFNSIIKNESHKLYHLLPPKARNHYNLRKSNPFKL